MGYSGTHWPEGLNDEEALQRLQRLCLAACDGIQDLADDTRYKALRRALLGRTDLRPLAPAFVAAQPSLEAFVRHAREAKDRAIRRLMVREQFKGLWDEVRGPDAVSSASRTGRPSLAAYSFALTLKTLSGLTPYEYRAKIWASEPDQLIVDPIHQIPGLNT